MDRADHVNAADYLDAALNLWRDPPLADVPASDAGQRLRLKILEERHGTFHDLVDARLALGQHQQAIPDLMSHVDLHTADERAWGLLMIALYRSGRRADSLETYLRARTVLVEAHGIDPGPCLKQIHQGVLADAV